MRISAKENNVFTSVWRIYESDRCVILGVELRNKHQKPDGLSQSHNNVEVWFDDEVITISDLPFRNCNCFASTSKNTTFITIYDNNIQVRPIDILWDSRN